VLDAGVVIKAIGREVLAVARVLEASVRHLSGQRDVGVDPDGPEVEELGEAHGPLVVIGPNRGSQPVLDVVGPLKSLVIPAEALNGEDGAKDLVLDVLILLLETRDNCWLQEVTLAT